MTASRSKSFFSALALLAALGAAGPTEVRIPTGIKLGESTLTYSLKAGPLPPVSALAYNADGSILAAGTYRAVLLWDAKTGKPLATIPDLAGQVQSVAFHPKQSYLAVAGGEPGRGAQAIVIDLKDHSRRTHLLGHNEVVSHIAWSADGTLLATAGHDKAARIWSWPGGMVKMVLRGHSDSVTRVCFSPDGASVYTASTDRNLRRFESATGKLVRTYGGSGDVISSLAVSPDGRNIVSSGGESRIRWWNPDSSDTQRFSDGSYGEVTDLLFSRDGKTLVSCAADNRVRFWRVDNGSHFREFTGNNEWVYAAALSMDGKLVAGAGPEGIIRVWEAETVRLRAHLAAKVGPDTTEWLAVTPEGYHAGSDRWVKMLEPGAAGKPVEPRIRQFVRTLLSAEQVATALKPGDLKIAEIPAAAAKKEGK